MALTTEVIWTDQAADDVSDIYTASAETIYVIVRNSATPGHFDGATVVVQICDDNSDPDAFVTVFTFDRADVAAIPIPAGWYAQVKIINAGDGTSLTVAIAY